MSADQIAEIRPAVRESIEGKPHTCVTLEVEGHPGKWLQIVDGTINAAYPHGDHPEQRLRSFGSAALQAKLAKWEPGNFVTFEVTGEDLVAISHWIDEYFVQMLGCAAGEYHLNIGYEQL